MIQLTMVSQNVIQVIIILCHHLESVKAQLKISYLFNIALHFTGQIWPVYKKDIINNISIRW